MSDRLVGKLFGFSNFHILGKGLFKLKSFTDLHLISISPFKTKTKEIGLGSAIKKLIQNWSWEAISIWINIFPHLSDSQKSLRQIHCMLPMGQLRSDKLSSQRV